MVPTASTANPATDTEIPDRFLPVSTRTFAATLAKVSDMFPVNALRKLPLECKEHRSNMETVTVHSNMVGMETAKLVASIAVRLGTFSGELGGKEVLGC